MVSRRLEGDSTRQTLPRAPAAGRSPEASPPEQHGRVRVARKENYVTRRERLVTLLRTHTDVTTSSSREGVHGAPSSRLLLLSPLYHAGSYAQLEQELRLLRGVHYQRYHAVRARYLDAERRPRQVPIIRGKPIIGECQEIVAGIPQIGYGVATLIVETWEPVHAQALADGLSWLEPRCNWQVPRELLGEAA